MPRNPALSALDAERNAFLRLFHVSWRPGLRDLVTMRPDFQFRHKDIIVSSLGYGWSVAVPGHTTQHHRRATLALKHIHTLIDFPRVVGRI